MITTHRTHNTSPHKARMEATETIAMGGTAASPGPSCTGKIETTHHP